jgi:hypothetical protein
VCVCGGGGGLGAVMGAQEERCVCEGGGDAGEEGGS